MTITLDRPDTATPDIVTPSYDDRPAAPATTRPGAGTPPDDDYETTNEDGKAAHIVFVPDDGPATAQGVVLEARIYGHEVQALCGYRWIPQQDPKKLPVCQKCLDIYHQPGDNRDDRERLPDA